MDKLPTRLLNRSIFVLSEMDDPRAMALMGWHAPVFAYVGLEKEFPVKLGFVYHASLMDVTGTIRARKDLTIDAGVERALRATTGPVFGGPEKKLPWEQALGGLSVFEEQDLPAIRNAVSKRDADAGPKAFAAVCATMDRYTRGADCSWQDFLEHLERDRFTASAWFERDRAHLCLRDEVLGREVISLWDDEVEEELAAGFLRRPRAPRPSDEDWVQPLLELARERGLVTSLRAPERQPARERNRP